MNINKNHNGSVLITDIINNQYIHQTYYAYTIKECIRKFKTYIKNLTK